MARLFVQYLTIYNNEKFAQLQKHCQRRFKILSKLRKIAKNLIKYCQTGVISPNLVTLASCFRQNEMKGHYAKTMLPSFYI